MRISPQERELESIRRKQIALNAKPYPKNSTPHCVKTRRKLELAEAKILSELAERRAA